MSAPPVRRQAFAAEDRAMTTIDTAQLVAIAFVQAPDRKILQAARADVTAAPAGKTAATHDVRR